MPLPRVFLFSSIALALLIATLWSMNLNLIGWIGGWFSHDNAMSTGLAMVLFAGLAGGWIYSAMIGTKLPGPGPIRGVTFGLLIGALLIWALPTLLSGTATAVQGAQTIYQGSMQENKDVEASPIPPWPDFLKKVDPPLASFTKGKHWWDKDDWQNRVAPFVIAFGLYGLILGLFLTEHEKQKND